MPKNQPEDISLKSTKREILSAYKDALEKLKTEAKEDIKREKSLKREQDIVEKAGDNSREGIAQHFSSFKMALIKSLDETEENMTGEFVKFTELRSAIESLKNELNELYEIRANADSLNALILAQKDRKESFEKEMEQSESEFEQKRLDKEQDWKKEQQRSESAFEEQMEELKKKRQRDEEEHQYKTKISRKKDEDDYASRKESLEKDLCNKRDEILRDLKERETALSSQEKELLDLRDQVSKFPQELKKAVTEAENAVRNKLTYEFSFQKELTGKGLEGETKLNEQRIATLESRIKQQEAFIAQLTSKADFAGKQVQEIAMKAIEGAAVSIARSHSESKKTSETN